jgi:rhamnosyltransferase subunit B
MRFLIAASGSYGDILPFVALGRELKRRGHDVLLFASSYFVPLISASGLDAVGIGAMEVYEDVIRHPDAFHPRRGIRLIAATNLEHLPEAYRRMKEQVVPGATVLVGSTLAFAPRLVGESLRVPTAIVHLAPSIFRSARKPPRFEEKELPAWLPPGLNRLLFWAIDTLVVDPMFADLNRFRGEVLLGPVKRIFGPWIHEGDLVVGLFPRWFAEPEVDWPDHVKLTGFPLYDGSAELAGAPAPELEPELERFLEAGAPPVLFTAGTAAASERRFYEESAEACRRGGFRGLLVTRYEEQLPVSLPEGVRHFDYVPFARVLPRLAAIVHHGGIGTASQALAAGIPQLVRPLAYDQFDNSLRLSRIGVSRELPQRTYRAQAAAEALSELTRSSDVSDACARAKERLTDQDAVSETCDVLIGELGARVRSSVTALRSG